MSSKKKVDHDDEHVAAEANGNFDRSWRDEKWGERKLSVVAQEIDDDEKDLSISDAIKHYPKAIGWCLVISTCVIMEGYDTNLSMSAGPSFASRMADLLQWAISSPIHRSSASMAILLA